MLRFLFGYFSLERIATISLNVYSDTAGYDDLVRAVDAACRVLGVIYHVGMRVRSLLKIKKTIGIMYGSSKLNKDLGTHAKNLAWGRHAVSGLTIMRRTKMRSL